MRISKTAALMWLVSLTPVAAQEPARLARVDPQVTAAVMRGQEMLDVVLTVRFDHVPQPWAPPGTVASERGLSESKAFPARLARLGVTRLQDSGAGSFDASIPARAIDTLRRDRVILAIDAQSQTESFSNLVSIREIIKAAPNAPFPLNTAKGLGQEIVIIDAAFDPDNPAYALSAGPFAPGYQINEECFSTTQKCRNSLGQPTNRSSGPGATRVFDPPPAGQIPNYHGGVVAQIVSSQYRVHSFGASFEGIAPSATVTLISVFNGWKPDGDPRYDDVSINNALDWIIQQVNPSITNPPRPIRSVNISFGEFPQSGQSCTTMSRFNQYRTRVQTLNSFGVAVVAAAGNSATAPIALPACIGEVVSVGETFNSPIGSTTLTVATTFGTDPFINVAAPTDETLLMDRLPNSTSYDFRLARGTSIAAPQVAGCAALLGEKLSPGKYSPPSLKSALMNGMTQAQRDLPPIQSTSLLNCFQAFQALEFGSGAISLNRFGLSGSWYDPSSSGQGLVIEVAQPQLPTQAGVVFGAWFTYSKDVTQPNERGLRWYTIQSAPTNWTSSDFSANIAVLESGPASFMTPNPSGASIIKLVGTGRIKFRSCNQGELTWDRCDVAGQPRPVGPPLLACNDPLFSGIPTSLNSLAYQRGTQQIVRLGQTNDCSEGNATSSEESESEYAGRASSNRLPRSLVGVWNPFDPNNPSASYAGQGLLLDINPGFPIGGGSQGIFGAWFTHVRTGDASVASERLRWWTLELPEEVPGSGGLAYQFAIAYTRGGRFAIRPPAPSTGWVGNATLTFSPNCQTATLSYLFFNGSPFDPGGSMQMPGFNSPPTSGTIHLRKGTLPNNPACVVPLP